MMWRHGTIRADRWHLPGFFAFLFSITLLAPIVFPEDARLSPSNHYDVLERFSLALSLIGLIAVFPKPFVTNLASALRETFQLGSWVVAPKASAAAWQGEAQRSLDELALPDLREATRNRKVFFHGYSLGSAIANINQLQLSPVLQSYSAYTAKLQEFDAKALEAFDPHGLVVLQDGTIDQRYPTIDSTGILEKLLATYRPVSRIKSFTLFEKSAQGGSEGEEAKIVLRWNEWHPLGSPGAGYLRASFSFGLSPLGKTLRFFFPLPQPKIEIEGEDGKTSEFILPFRAAQQGFILSPFSESPATLPLDAVNFPRSPVKRFRVQTSRAPFYRNEIGLSLHVLNPPTNTR